MDPTRPDRVDDRLLNLADHLTPNADEAAQMTGLDVASEGDARRVAERLRERGARAVHVKLRDGGCLSSSADGNTLLRLTDEAPVVDTTGAGDAFAASLAVALVARHSIIEAARLAVAAAACAVTAFGAQSAYPDRRRLERMAANVSDDDA